MSDFQVVGYQDYTISKALDTFGADVSGGLVQTYNLGHNSGWELSEVVFTPSATADGAKVEWSLIHPKTNKHEELVLAQGIFDKITANEEIVQTLRSGIIGYLRLLAITFREVTVDVTPATSMLVTVKFKQVT